MRYKLRRADTKKVPTFVNPNNQLSSKFTSHRADKNIPSYDGWIRSHKSLSMS